VGVMKGVILTRIPGATIVDVSHGIPPGDVRSGAFALRAAYRYFPPGAVHVVVVDPGVGSSRRAIAAQAQDCFFVAPDNGVISPALAQAGTTSVRQITRTSLFLQPTSRTFHGRDVFAPVAAFLADGGAFDTLGPEIADYVRLPLPGPVRTEHGWEGEVEYCDRFGNAITNIPNEWIAGANGWQLELAGGSRYAIGGCYSDVGEGEVVGVPGSSGFLEIAVRNGNAARVLGLSVGSIVRVFAGGETVNRHGGD